ncbi:hypothetical protein GW17_00062228 [Ensete ventricosum]|nr:hypothetical protein GW17_00062228 [Ensete ventricosum]
MVVGNRPLCRRTAGSRGWQPLARWRPPLVRVALQPAPFRAPRCGRLPPLRAGLGHDLVVGGRPCMGASRPSSSLPSLRKRNKNA